MQIERNKDLTPYTTFGISGRAEYFGVVSRPTQFFEALAWADKMNVRWRLFAGGSNLVLPSARISGLVLRMYGGRIRRKNATTLRVDAGVPLAKVVDASIRLGLEGLERLSGIPGTVGGAVAGNAGAYGCSIGERVVRVLVWNGKNEVWLERKECEFKYRESVFKHRKFVILVVELAFSKGDGAALRFKSREIIKERLKKYPKRLRCPGSYFKNIPTDRLSKKTLSRIDTAKIIGGKVPAGYLLEAVGAKGMRRGGMMVAPYHGNLIVNTDGGTSKDAKTLARTLKERVKKRFGITLEEEVRYW